MISRVGAARVAVVGLGGLGAVAAAVAIGVGSAGATNNPAPVTTHPSRQTQNEQAQSGHAARPERSRAATTPGRTVHHQRGVHTQQAPRVTSGQQGPSHAQSSGS